jgi:hypothetical protein
VNTTIQQKQKTMKNTRILNTPWAAAAVAVAAIALATTPADAAGVCQVGVLNTSGINPATGLEWAPGDTYRLVFITSTTTAVTSTDISTYNAFVNTVADSSTTFPDLGDVNWSVVGSTATVAARDNTGTGSGTGVPVLRMDGFAIANNNADLWNGIVATHVTGQNYLAIHLNENGLTTLDDRVRTGTMANGTASATQMLGAVGDVQTGRNYTPDFYGNYGGSGWMADWHASGDGRVYAMSETLTVAIPEPSAALLSGLGLLALLRRRR